MKTSMKWVALALAACLPLSAHAHKAWLLPSETVLSGADPWITVDAAVSNDLFFFNHVPLRLENLVVTAPDGSTIQPENSATGKYRSSFDVHLTKPGTYRVAVVNTGLNASWDEDGKPKRWRGTADAFAKEVPKDAKNLKVAQSSSRVETFVTSGNPNDTVLKPGGVGLELAPVTHPNDLFAGEAATFRLQLDGKPAADVALEIIPGGIRYRDKQNEIAAKTDKDGKFTVTWPSAGMYWLEASVRDSSGVKAPATERRANYAVTLEVLPQ